MGYNLEYEDERRHLHENLTAACRGEAKGFGRHL